MTSIQTQPSWHSRTSPALHTAVGQTAQLLRHANLRLAALMAENAVLKENVRELMRQLDQAQMAQVVRPQAQRRQNPKAARAVSSARAAAREAVVR